MLNINASYHCMQFQAKLMNQTWEKWQKTSFGTDFGPFGRNLGCKFYFFKNLALSVTRYQSLLLSCAISGKINHPILKRFSHRPTDGRTDRRTDGQTDWETDESDFIGHCRTNFECPTTLLNVKSLRLTK